MNATTPLALMPYDNRTVELLNRWSLFCATNFVAFIVGALHPSKCGVLVNLFVFLRKVRNASLLVSSLLGWNPLPFVSLVRGLQYSMVLLKVAF